MLLIFAPLVVGYFISITNKEWLNTLNKATTNLVYIILFLMGLNLSSLDNLSGNMQTIGQYTLVFFIFMALCNFATLPILDRLYPIDIESKKTKLPLSHMALDSIKLILVVGGGLVIGRLQPYPLTWVESTSEAILFLLLFFIGIQLRNSGLTLKQIVLNKHGMIISLVVMGSCWLGGLAAGFTLDLPVAQSLAMSSGFGWYSLSGILMGDAYGPVFGGSSFLIELLRELLSLMLIPMFISRSPCTSIGYAGATAMDFTLPVIQTTGGVKCVPVAIVSGFILSLLVPLLMLFFVSLPL
ncbi:MULTISPECIES: lysine exporter LysO family protein [Vibrio]|uniref:DUF340 domain-containing protein n=2 Tax=Vibrio TaxID=662 RepID=A0A7X4LPH7_9VIBR|nr:MULTISPECIES: lysine exporter LysO family protein [Vibrio]MBF9000050.1 lysine exporter LysO family protein [Vibrio nitrifigilis]MZI95788.1 DUF340 domain-containing protein [Vibrio eleionomae]